VDDVSLDLRPGETLGLVGESGSGKTTVGRCILRLIEPTSGSIVFQGQDIARLKSKQLRHLRSRMQMVFQEPYSSFDPRMKIADIIAEPLEWAGEPKTVRRNRATELVEMVGLDRRVLNLYPHQLSGGQQQRAGIARAIATNPDLLILDEPTSTLDLTARAEINDLLVQLQEELKIAYIFISHDLTSVRYLSHRVAVMYLGKLVEIGPWEEVFEDPQHPYTKALLQSVLFFDRNLRHERKFVLEGEIPSPVDLPAGCHLYGRCPLAEEACQYSYPDLLPISQSHRVACFVAQRAASQRGSPAVSRNEHHHNEHHYHGTSDEGRRVTEISGNGGQST
jgi:oligopeptide transport system ATP-binding protein